MKYLIMVYTNPMMREAWASFSNDERAAGWTVHNQVREDMAAAGELVQSEALVDPGLAKRITVRDGDMVATYRQSVLTAFSEVEDNLAAQALLADEYSEESDALLAARKQLEIANNRYRDGLITYLEVATAESTALNVEFAAVQLHGQQLVAAVTLIKSLGGGWPETMKQ